MRLQLVMPILFVLVTGCGADNANLLADEIGEGAARLVARGSGSSITVSVDPVNGSASPYTVIFFPSREIAEADLVAAGVEMALARRIYSEMGYLGNLAGTLVVAQEGQRLKFTSSWKQFPFIQAPEDVVVSRRKVGIARIDLRQEAGVVRVVAIQ